jgi:hypothetical protein
MVEVRTIIFFFVAVFCFIVLAFGSGDLEPCIALKRASERISLEGGHTRQCFTSAVISFESCRQLLYRSNTCSSLSYKDMKCSLHDHTRLNFKKSTTTPGVSGPLVYTKEDVRSTSLSPHEACSQHGFKSAFVKFEQCVAGELEPEPAGPELLPRLGIVISVTKHWALTHKADIASVTSNFECYAAAHNYTFLLNIMDDMPAGQFFHERHHVVRQQLLRRFHFLLHLDADSLVLNISRSLDQYLRPDSPHVQLHMHENGEVTAAAYLVRNSAYSRCFLQYWADFSPPHERQANSSPGVYSSALYDERLYEVPNYDNGDLVSAVMNMLGPDVYLTCMRVVASLSPKVKRQFINIYHQTVVECWKMMQPSLRAREREWSDGNLKIYLPKEGFWRTHSRRNRYGSDPKHWWNMVTASCFPSSDLLGHGWKGMVRNMWPLLPDERGGHSAPRQPPGAGLCRAATETAASGGNPNCVWLGPTEELQVASRFCSWKAPVCLPGDDEACAGTDELQTAPHDALSKATTCNL